MALSEEQAFDKAFQLMQERREDHFPCIRRVHHTKEDFMKEMTRLGIAEKFKNRIYVEEWAFIFLNEAIKCEIHVIVNAENGSTSIGIDL